METDEHKDVDLDQNNEEEELDLNDDNDANQDTKDWKAEALKYKSMANRYKGKLADKQENKPVQKENISERVVPKPSDILKADEFKLYRQGYTESEIDLIMHNGGMKALADEKSPLSLGLKAAREQRQAEEAADQASNNAGLSEVERKYTTEQLKNMSVKELEAILPHAN